MNVLLLQIIKIERVKFKKIFLVSMLALSFLAFKADDYFEISKNLDIFAQVYKQVLTTYVDEVQPGELIRAAIDGMLKSLDPYTNFYSEAQSEDYRFQITGTYAGIGCSLKKREDEIIIESPYEGYPAQKAGLRHGDILLEVDNKPVEGKNIDEITTMLKGNAGTTVLIKIKRPNKEILNISVSREKITLKNVPYYKLLENEVGYIKLTGFMPDAGKEVAEALTALKTQGAKQIVLDLRGNGGGLLNEAINIVGLFVPKGTVVVETRAKLKEEQQVFKTRNEPLDTDIRLAVLIDGRSASASEIVSGALQDLDRVIVLGQKSFGKGLVQTTKSLKYNTQMKITTSKYYLPSGRLIQKLDYSKKVKGRAVAVADSLKHLFYTRNKRPVKDGEGISPDIEVVEPALSQLAQSLLKKGLIDDFATIYRSNHDNISPALSFTISESIFSEFKTFLNDKEYQYQTGTEIATEKLLEEAKAEGYEVLLSPQFVSLNNRIKELKTNDLEINKEEIRKLLGFEIVRRYYFEKGEIEVSFQTDEVLKEAFKILLDSARYTKVLTVK